MIKKVEKDYDNFYGIEKIDDSFSFNKPILLTMIPINTNYRDINGYFSQLMYLMQIRSLNTDSNYTIGNMPFDMVSGEFREPLAEKIVKNIPIGDISAIKQYMRNINIFSYCAGNNNTAKMLHMIYNYLEQNNYSQNEIEEIMQEIFVLQIVDNHFEKNSVTPIPYATTVIVQDIYDLENITHVLDFNSDNPFISTMKVDGVRYMLYNSFGEKSLSKDEREHSFKDDYVLAPVINTVISLYIIKAISISLNNTSKKDISIYNELQLIIKKTQEYINSKNKIPEELTINEKLELNKILFEEIKRIFLLNIPSKELTSNEKNYLMKKDETINILKSRNVTDIFDKSNNCIEIINIIIDTYNSHSYGEIIGQKYVDNSGKKIDITREDDINSKLSSLEKNLDDINQLIANIKYPDDIPQMIKSEFIDKVSSVIETIKDKINSEKFQSIITEVLERDSILKK